MNPKKLMKSFNFSLDLINVFKIYASCLDDYFKVEDNRINHKELYNYYQQLNINIKNSMKKNGLDKL